MAATLQNCAAGITIMIVLIAMAAIRFSIKADAHVFFGRKALIRIFNDHYSERRYHQFGMKCQSQSYVADARVLFWGQVSGRLIKGVIAQSPTTQAA